MVGITSYGVYTPYYRLSRDAIRKAWELPPSFPGEKAIANYDEDSITMASESIFNCLERVGEVKVDGLFSGTVSYPSPEKGGAATVAAIIDLPEEILTADFSRSMRAGTAALRSALDAVKGDSAKNVITVASDCRLAEPGSNEELIFGAGSACLLVGDKGVIAELVGYFSISDNLSKNIPIFILLI